METHYRNEMREWSTLKYTLVGYFFKILYIERRWLRKTIRGSYIPAHPLFLIPAQGPNTIFFHISTWATWEKTSWPDTEPKLLFSFQIKEMANNTALFPKENKRSPHSQGPNYALPENKMAAILQNTACIFSGKDTYTRLWHTLDSSLGHLALKNRNRVWFH